MEARTAMRALITTNTTIAVNTEGIISDARKMEKNTGAMIVGMNLDAIVAPTSASTTIHANAVTTIAGL